MIEKYLIVFGLAIIPFFNLSGSKTREPKMLLAVAFAFAITLFAVYYGKLKPLKNRWLLLFVGYLFFSVLLAPKPFIDLWGLQVKNFWVWQPMFKIIVFFFMFVAVASIEWRAKDISLFLNTMVWAGFIMAVYAVIQFLRLDQFFYVIPDRGVTTMPHIGGTLGNPTVMSSFIAMLVPIAFYLKRYWKALAIIIAVCLTCSQVAIGAMVISLMVLVAVKNKRTIVVTGAILLAVVLFLGIGYFKSSRINAFIGDNGRFSHWEQIAKDLNSPINAGSKKKYPLTGLGMGSFKYIYHLKHKNSFHQAHNDYLELAYNTGLIGLILFLCAIGYMLKQNFSLKAVRLGKINKYRLHLLSSFICVSICAGGTFVFQLGSHIFYTIVVAGLLSSTQRGEL